MLLPQTPSPLPPSPLPPSPLPPSPPSPSPPFPSPPSSSTSNTSSYPIADHSNMTSPISPESTLLHEELKEIIFTLAAYVTRLKDDRSKIRLLVAKMNSYLVDLGFDIDNNALGGAKPSSELYAILQDKERAQLRLAGMDCDYEQLGIRLEKLIEAERVLKQRLM